MRIVGRDAVASEHDAVASKQEELERRLQEVDLLRRRVLNVIPHALRTPITTFRGLVELMPSASEPEIRSTITPALQRLAAQAERLLDDMLLAAGLSTTLPTGARVATPVAPTAGAAWAEVASGREPLRIEGDEAVTALAHGGSLFKVFTHLLDNAAKYGTGDPFVRIERSTARVLVAVESPGEAVPEIEMLGEPFFRGERAVMGSAGLGVCLAVAKALVEHAGGSLEIAAGADGGLITAFELEAG